MDVVAGWSLQFLSTLSLIRLPLKPARTTYDQDKNHVLFSGGWKNLVFGLVKQSDENLMKLFCRQLSSSLALDQNPDREIKLKTEIERNENSIELLTLIFLFSSLVRVLTTRPICLSRVDDGNWSKAEKGKFFHMKIEWNARSERESFSVGHAQLSGDMKCTGKHWMHFGLFTFCHLWSHATHTQTLNRRQVCLFSHAKL